MCERLAAGNCSTGLGSKRLFERCCPLAARETDAWRHRQARDGWRVEQPDSEIPRMARHEAVRRDLCSGTVTFLFTDVEGSTKLLHKLGVAAYAEATAEHREILRRVFSAHAGVEVDTQGDAFFVASQQRTGRCA
jgi:class 3 adenylate cyclase